MHEVPASMYVGLSKCETSTYVGTTNCIQGHKVHHAQLGYVLCHKALACLQVLVPSGLVLYYMYHDINKTFSLLKDGSVGHLTKMEI